MRTERCQPVLAACPRLVLAAPYPGRVPCCSWCREWHPARCDAIPRHLAQVSCTTLNRRWIHPCWVGGAVFSVAEGYACPLCKLTLDMQLASYRAQERSSA